MGILTDRPPKKVRPLKHYNPRARQCWYVSIGHPELRKLLPVLAPYLRVKQPQAHLAIELLKLISTEVSWKTYPEEVRARRVALVRAISKLNTENDRIKERDW